MIDTEPGSTDRQVALLAASRVVAAMIAAQRHPQDTAQYTLRMADKFHTWLQQESR